MGKKRWVGVLVIWGLMIWGPGALLAGAEKGDKPSVHGSDSRQFTEELRSSGAIKFYEDTEDLLRTGKFERAFGRYLFLNPHIRGQALYTGLTAAVDQRLNFLKSQMRLGETTLHYEPIKEPEKRRTRVNRTPACPPLGKTADKTSPPDSAEKPPEIIIPPAATPDQEKAPPPEEKKPPAEEAQKPAPPPSAWEKLKRRLKFW